MAPRPPPPPSPNVRRSNRASLPDTYLMYRREIIRETFCKTAVQTAKKKLKSNCAPIKSKLSAKVQSKSKSKSKSKSIGNNRKQRYINRQTKPTKQLNGSSCGNGDDTADAQRLSPSAFNDGLIDSKKEKLDDTMDEASIPNRFGNYFINGSCVFHNKNFKYNFK